MANSFDAEGPTLRELAVANVVAGTFAFSNTIAKFYSKSAKTGESVSPYAGGCSIRVEKTTAGNTFAIGADVFGDVSTQKALTAGGTGKLGYCCEASVSGATHVHVRMIN